MTGFPSASAVPEDNDRPSVGSIAARVRGPNAPGVPPYVSLPNMPQYGAASYLGAGYNPFNVEGDPQGTSRVRNLDLARGLNMGRLEDRKYLLSKLDRIERERDASGTMDGIDHFTAQAYEMVTGPAARRAFDMSREDPRLRDRYGRTPIGQRCLLARRLVEAGVTFVTITEGNWDHHGTIFPQCKQMLPPLDQRRRDAGRRPPRSRPGRAGAGPRLGRVRPLAEDLQRRPRPLAGRDVGHGRGRRPEDGPGRRRDQPQGGIPGERPLRPEDMIQTVYHVLGINPLHEFLNESGRPMPILNTGQPDRRTDRLTPARRLPRVGDATPTPGRPASPAHPAPGPPSMKPSRLGLVAAFWLGLAEPAPGQFPRHTLTSIFPPGGEAGTNVTVEIAGTEIDTPIGLAFDHPGLRAFRLKGPKFVVAIGTGVPRASRRPNHRAARREQPPGVPDRQSTGNDRSRTK